MRVARQDLEAYVWRFANVLMVDPVEATCRLSRRPAGIRGNTVWPQDRLLELILRIAGLPDCRIAGLPDDGGAGGYGLNPVRLLGFSDFQALGPTMSGYDLLIA
jgi:hypothetical protein